MPTQKIDKQAFLMRCWEVFHTQGYHNTSMQDLAAATGLQKAGLYHHYPTKEALMQSVMAFALEQFHAYVLSVAHDESLPVEQRLEKLLRRNKRIVTAYRRGCFFANIGLETGRDEQFNTLIQQAMQDWIDTVAGLLAHGMPPDQARREAGRLMMEFEGSVLFYKIYNNTDYLDAFIDRAVRLLGTPQKAFAE
jgi:AcrR family transcriptional regulator